MKMSSPVYHAMWRQEERSVTSGLLIVLCGFDGSGKTTQAELLEKFLIKKGRRVLRTKQPTDWYRQEPSLRSYIDAGTPVDQKFLALLAATDRRKHIVEVIDPAMSAGIDVISDRYVYSTLAYFSARGLNAEHVALLNRDIPRPDLAIVLDAPASTLFERIKLRDGARHKHEERSVLSIDKVRINFLTIAETDPSILVIDARDPAEAIHNRICQELDRKSI